MGLAALLLLAGCDKPAGDAKPAAREDAETPGITLSEEQVKSLGITTRPAAGSQYRPQLTGYGVVTALDSIAQADAEVVTAQAAAAQSRAAASRAQSLATGEEAAVSREVVETAQSKAAADQAALALARRKADTAFGQHAPWQNAAVHHAMMARLASGRTVLVRVTFPLGSLGTDRPGALRIARLGASPESWTATAIWEAPSDAALPGRGFYALLDGSDLAQNEHVTATIPVGMAAQGVLVPARALVYGDSQAWVYVETRSNTFLRTRVDTAEAVGDGYFVADGIKPGQAVVVDGAGLLMAHETNPSTAAGD